MKDLNLSRNEEIKKCLCIKKYVMITRDGPYVSVTHEVNDICECKELLDSDGEIIGYYVKYDVFRLKLLSDFNEHYKIMIEN